jgi:GT2 family glycosyltransferase
MHQILDPKPLTPMIQPRYKDKKKVSIIIVEYKSGGALQKLLRLIPIARDWEVIVVDNSIINRGFGKACNEGVRKAKGEYVLFLNPDVEINGQSIKKMMFYLQNHSQVGAVGPTFLNPDGSIEQSSTEFPTFLKATVALSFLQKLPFLSKISDTYWMKSWKRNTSRSVDVLSGAAIMMRTKDFRTLGGFDARFFLYWEEFDLCKRISTQLKKKCIYLSEITVTHPKGVSMSMLGDKSQEYFKQSRWCFFQKYFGLFPAIAIELFLTISESWQLLFLSAIAFYFRATHLNFLNIIGDLGRDYIAALDMLGTRVIPLLGIPSSIPRFSQGPLNIWFSAFSFLFGGVSPFSPPLFAALLATAGIAMLFILLSKQYGKHTSLYATLLLTTSPAAVLQSRLPFYLFGVPVFLVLLLKKGMQLRKSSFSIFTFVFSWWLLFQWELATLPLGVLVFFFFLVKKISIKKAFIPTLFATLFGLAPQILYDVTHQCAQLCGLAAWVGYRAAAIFGVFQREPLTLHQIQYVATQSVKQLQLQTGGEVIGLTLIMLIVVIGILSQLMKKYRDSLVLGSIVGSVLLAISIVIHGEPSEAYFPPFLVFGSIFVAQALSIFSPSIRKIVGFSLIVLSIWNGYQLVSHSFYTKQLRPQLDAAQFIVQEAAGQQINLVSYDSPTYKTYLDGVRFLIRVYGGTLGDQDQRYVVSLEDSAVLPDLTHDQHIFSYVKVLVPVKELVR